LAWSSVIQEDTPISSPTCFTRSDNGIFSTVITYPLQACHGVANAWRDLTKPAANRAGGSQRLRIRYI
jgi:hypothetical protein